MIRKIYNLAIAEFFIDRKILSIGKEKIQIRIPELEKIGLSIEEVKRLENATNLTVPQQHALNTWPISFYFAGVRVSDVLQLRWSDFNDGRLLYRMNKNLKLVSLKIPEKAHCILKLYKPFEKNRNDLVFHFLKKTDFYNAKELLIRTRTVTRTLNRCLELIAIKSDIDKKCNLAHCAS